jgi:hypothetical protein
MVFVKQRSLEHLVGNTHDEEDRTGVCHLQETHKAHRMIRGLERVP